MKLHVEASATVAAPQADVWALLADTESYADWGIWQEAEVVESPVDGTLAGTVRRLRLGRTNTVERIVEADAPNRMTYTVLSGIPVRNYLAEVTLEPRGDRTELIWWADWDSTFAGRIVQLRLRKLYPEIVRRLAEAAAERATNHSRG